METISNRLQKPAGLLIDHDKPIVFSFEGQTYTGLLGDTIASALAANDVWLISRSFKYHRPRGVMSMAGLEANTLVQLENEPNVAADRRKISPNLKVSGQNYTGSLENDKETKINFIGKFLPVGFYYKAFFRPRGIWQNFWEPIVRKRAGLGCVNQNTAHEYYDKSYKFCDVAVIGGGPAGLKSALTTAEAGAEVVLIEQEPILGGSLNYARFDAEATIAPALRNDFIEAIIKHPNIEVMTNSVCNGWFADNWLPIINGNRMYKLRAKQMILASGNMEQPAIFHNNDLPGVLLGSATQRLIRLYGVRPGKRAVVLTAGDYGYAVALDLIEHGVEVAAIADLRESPAHLLLYEKIRDLNITVYHGYTVYAAKPRADKNHINEVELRKIIAQGQCANESKRYNCDLLSVSVGFTPTYQLALQAGGKISYDDETAMFSITQLPKCLHLAGAADSANELSALFESGKRAAQTVCNHLRLAVKNTIPIQTDSITSYTNINHPWPIFAHPQGKEFVDLDEDVQFADIINAYKDGYSELELVKRYSTVGMGPSQGRHSALATARLVANESRRTVAEIGVTTARPPFRAEKLGVIAGRRFEPERFTAMHHRHLEAGAKMIPAGLWWRPAYYGAKQNREQCVRDENLAIRNNVGLIDVSTLGGLEIRGPDAAEFLNRIYTFAYAKQKINTVRYLLMTNTAGTIIDDGVACRFGDEHFYVTATTGGVDNVHRTMLWWNAQWCLDVDVTNVTAAYAGVNIAGPKAREVLKRVCNDIDLSTEGFPYLALRSGTVANIPARLLRVGFVGELGYEIHVPYSQGEALWDILLEAGKKHDIQPVGIEAQRSLRLEKGHIIVSQDTDAMTTPQEVQMTWAIAKKKPFFVGGRSLQLIDKHPYDRKLVGFTIEQIRNKIPKESNLILNGEKIVGHITSVAYSPTLNKIIGLAYAEANTELGMSIDIKLSCGTITTAYVVEIPFYDPKNKRQEI